MIPFFQMSSIPTAALTVNIQLMDSVYNALHVLTLKCVYK